MSIEEAFSKTVCDARCSMELTQEEVASALSISSHTYSEIENGDLIPSGILALSIIAFLGIDGVTLGELTNAH